MSRLDTDFLKNVDCLSGQQLEMCYHCHTCTAGCPLSANMVYGPDRLLRLIELGERDRVLSAPDIWLCVSCETCTIRCPNNIDVAAVMDSLRHMSRSETEPRIRLFHRVYLNVIKVLGRSHEAIMLGLYKIRSLDLLSDLQDGLRLMIRGKIPLLPHRIKGASDVKRIYEAAQKADQEQLEAKQ